MRFARLRRAWSAWKAPPPAPTVLNEWADKPEAKGVSAIALVQAIGATGTPLVAFELPEPGPGVMPAAMAMDSGVPAYASQMASALMSWGLSSRFHEGMAFLGYPYLAELAQRSEYRKISETIARDATRKWCKLGGPDEAKLKQLADAMRGHQIQSKFQKISETDGYFGRAQLFVDVGETNLQTTMVVDKAAIGKGKLKGFTVVEPVWTYPGEYNATKPLEPDFYVPREWYVMGELIHRSRLLTFVTREVPDMLKATYAFGGLSMSQMAKPYVDNWLRTRQSVSDLIHSFSTMVLKTNMATVLQGGPATDLINRIAMANRFRDNRGMFVVDKDTEELENISAPLANLDDLQTQAQEQMCAVSGIPRLILLGLSPKGTGIGNTGDGEIQTYYGGVHSYQERVFRPHLTTVIQLIQLDLWGEIDPKITFEFHPLYEMDAKSLAEIRKSDAEADKIYVDAGVVDPDEARERLAEDETGLYFGVDLSGPAPGIKDDEDEDMPVARAADAMPRPLYVRREVLNVGDISEWALANGIPVTEDLHVTLAHSSTPVDWMLAGEPYEEALEIQPGGPRLVEPLGDMGAVILFASTGLAIRWKSLCDAGAAWDYPEFQPHIPITKQAVDLTNVQPYRGRIILGPEIFEPARGL